jgi:hypothetical protein
MTDETGDYAAVSRLAVAALGMGVVAAASLIGPAFLVLPLLGIALAVAAFADLRRAAGLKVGRLAALGGLALSVGFGAQAVTTLAVSRWQAARRAEAATLVFVQAVCDGRLDDARGMSSMENHAVLRGLADCCGGAPAAGDVSGGGAPAAGDVSGGGAPAAAGVILPGERAGTWRVRVTVGACGVEVLLGQDSGMVGDAPGERWSVLDCAVTPR